MQGEASGRNPSPAVMARALGVSQIMGYEDSSIPGVPTTSSAPSEGVPVAAVVEDETPRPANASMTPPQEMCGDDEVFILDDDLVQPTAPVKRSTL